MQCTFDLKDLSFSAGSFSKSGEKIYIPTKNHLIYFTSSSHQPITSISTTHQPTNLTHQTNNSQNAILILPPRLPPLHHLLSNQEPTNSKSPSSSRQCPSSLSNRRVPKPRRGYQKCGLHGRREMCGWKWRFDAVGDEWEDCGCGGVYGLSSSIIGNSKPMFVCRDGARYCQCAVVCFLGVIMAMVLGTDEEWRGIGVCCVISRVPDGLIVQRLPKDIKASFLMLMLFILMNWMKQRNKPSTIIPLRSWHSVKYWYIIHWIKFKAIYKDSFCIRSPQR